MKSAASRASGIALLVLAPVLAGAADDPETGVPVHRISAELPFGAELGATLALSGQLLAVGAPTDAPGKVRVYEARRGSWNLQGEVASPDAPGQGFARSIALDGSLLAVGAPNHSASLPETGIAYVFERRGTDGSGQWRHVATLRPGDPTIGMYFGATVAVQGGTVLVGAPGAQVDDVRSGAVFVYERRGDEWELADVLTLPDGVFNDFFSAIAVDGDTLVVGAHGRDGRGAAYLYRRNGDDWRAPELIGRLLPPTGDAVKGFGRVAALRGDILLVSAFRARRSGTRSGTAYVFRRQARPPVRVSPRAGGRFGEADAWRLEARLAAPGGRAEDGFGAALTIQEALIAVGAPRRDTVGTDTGAVYLFAPTADGSTGWEPTLRLTLSSGPAGDRFGLALSADERRLAVGAPGALPSGKAYVYDLPALLLDAPPAFERFAQPGGDIAPHSVHAMLEDEAGFLWFGTGDGLHLYDGYGYRSYRHDPADTGSLSNNGVLALLADRHGNYWIGTEDGINRLDRSEDRVVRYPVGQRRGHPRASFVAIFEDRDGNVWTGTNGRLYRYRPGTDRFDEYEPFTGPPEDLDEGYVSAIQEDSDGHLWVLGKNLWVNHASLYEIDVDAGTVERFPLGEEWGQVGPMLIDRSDRLWLKAPRAVPLPAAEGEVVRPLEPPVASAHWAILEDSDGTVWLGTDTGLYRRRPGEGSAKWYRIAGLPEMPATPLPSDWVRSLFETRSGVFLIGTRNGAYRADLYKPAAMGGPAPSAAAPHASRMPLVLTRVHVSSREGTREINPFGLRSLTLSYRDYNFGFEFAALDQRPGASPHYRYRLTGFDRDWIDAGSRRYALYTNVPPGSYTFEVEASSSHEIRMPGDGAVQPTSGRAMQPAGRLRVALTVTPAFWQTGWFRLVVVAAILSGLAAAYAYRVRVQRRLERLRLRIAGDLHDDLSTNLSGIALMSDALQRPGTDDAEVRRELASIRDTARGMVDDLRDIVWIIDPARDRVEDLLAKMRAVASMLLQDCSYSVRLEDGTGTGRIGMEKRREILLIYKELLHNVVRHSGARRVEVELRQSDGRLVLSVADDGVGFDRDEVSEGHGLRSLRARAARLGGDLRLTSAPGQGTRATLSIEI